MRHPDWPDIILGLFLVTMVVICTVAFGVTHAYAQPEGRWSSPKGDIIPPLQVQTDESQTLALERAVNAIRVNVYHQPERVPSSKLRSVARFWAVAYTPVAADVESTKLALIIFDTIKVSEFNPYPAPYYAVFDEPGVFSPDAIAAYWHAAIYRFWIYETPSYAFAGCSYRSVDGRTRAFCIFADTLDVAATATPLAMPQMATPRPMPSATRRY
jgi:hypothetical protein